MFNIGATALINVPVPFSAPTYAVGGTEAGDRLTGRLPTLDQVTPERL
jgi:hypothetical protein